MKLDELQKTYQQKYQAYKATVDEWLGKEEGIPEDISAELSKEAGELDQLKVKIEIAKGAASHADYAQEPAGTKAAHLGWRQSAPGEGDSPVDIKAWREITLDNYSVDPRLGIVVKSQQRMRFHVPLSVQGKDYPSAYESYMRKGYADMGPADRKTLSEGVDSAGGFLVPEDLHIEIIRKVATLATLRANARVVQTSRDIAKWPKLVYTTDDEYTSGVRLTWTGETPATATTHRVTDPKFGLYAIPVHTAMASLPLTNDLLEDSAFDIMGVASDLMAEAFTLGENDAFWNGNGITRPMGLLAKVDVTGEGPTSVKSGDANLLLSDGLVDLAYALPAQYERNAKFYFNKATEKAIRKLKDAVDGQYIWPIYPQVGGFGPAPRELLGYPILRDEFLPDIAANAYPIVFGDLTGYLVLDRVGISIQRLSELYAETNISLLLARKRVGGQLVQPWRLRVQKVAA